MRPEIELDKVTRLQTLHLPIHPSFHPSIHPSYCHVWLPRLTILFCTGAYPNTKQIKRGWAGVVVVVTDACVLHVQSLHVHVWYLLLVYPHIRSFPSAGCVCVCFQLWFTLSLPFQLCSLLTRLWLPPVAASQAAVSYPLPPTAPELLCCLSS